MKKRSLLFTFLITVLLVAACAPTTPTPETPSPVPPMDTAMPTSTAATASTNTPEAGSTGTPSTEETVVDVREDPTLGDILVDSEGMTLYIFTNDTPNTSTCYDSCATTWPPLLTQAGPAPAEGVDVTKLNTTERTDGTIQVTYNGWPLYYFASDMQPGDTLGQGVGSVWYVISPDGEMIQ